MIRVTMTALALAATGAALAKLPAPDEAAKAAAATTAAKTAWQGKVDAYLLCKVQDRVAAQYKSSHPQAKAAAATTAPAPSAGASAVASAAAAPASASLAAAPPPMPPAKPPAPAAQAPTTAASSATNPTSASASQGGSTPAVAVASPNNLTVPGCADPGPFAYAPPEQKPLESSEAHSPAANATSPPSVRPESGTMTDGKTGAKK